MPDITGMSLSWHRRRLSVVFSLNVHSRFYGLVLDHSHRLRIRQDEGSYPIQVRCRQYGDEIASVKEARSAGPASDFTCGKFLISLNEVLFPAHTALWTRPRVRGSLCTVTAERNTQFERISQTFAVK